MTSSNAPSGEVTRSGVYDSSYEAWQAFDATPTTLWLSETWETPAWIAYQWADGPKLVERYVLTFRNGAALATRAPKEFTLEGWNGSTWIVVDARHDQTNWVGSERREYEVADPGSYVKYRLNVTDDNDERAGVVVVSLGRIELIGPDCDSAGGASGSGGSPSAGGSVSGGGTPLAGAKNEGGAIASAGENSSGGHAPGTGCSVSTTSPRSSPGIEWLLAAFAGIALKRRTARLVDAKGR